jgi:hypothetical protein
MNESTNACLVCGVGWGTARVGVGMAFGNFVYDSCMARWPTGAKV